MIHDLPEYSIQHSLGCLFMWKNFSPFQSLKWNVCWRRLHIPTCIESSCDFLRRRKKPLPTCSLTWPDCFNSVFFASLINQEKALLQIQSSEVHYSTLYPVHAQASWSLGKRLTSGEISLFLFVPANCLKHLDLFFFKLKLESFFPSFS